MHIDIKHLTQMPGEEQKRYLYVAIDRATRWVYLEVRGSQSAKDARAFMNQVETKALFKIQMVLTYNRKSFTDRFTRAGERKPGGRHSFDQECLAHGIDHRLIKPGRPQTNGMVERFNGRISDVLATRRILQAKIWSRRSSVTAGCTIIISRRKRCTTNRRSR